MNYHKANFLLWLGYGLRVSLKFHVLKFNPYYQILRGWKLNLTMVFRGHWEN